MAKKAKMTDEEFRQYALTGSVWRVVLYVGLPLLFYQMLNTFYTIVDSLMAANINAEAVSTVAYISDINTMVQAIGNGLAVGGCIKLATSYGEGDYKTVKKQVSTLLAMSIGLGLLLVLAIPFTPLLLRLANTPEELIDMGAAYFSINLAGMGITFFNMVYIAIERARGSSKRIFVLNTIAIFIKLPLTALFVYVFQSGVTMIAVASLVSQLFIFVAGIYYITRKDSAFCFSWKEVSFTKKIAWPMTSMSLPVFFEKLFFSGGRVIVNSMCGFYGALTVGALGVSNRISGLFDSGQKGLQEGATALVSQNIGAGRNERVVEIVQKLLCITLIYGTVTTILAYFSVEPVSYLYAISKEGLNEEFRDIIRRVYMYEALGTMIPGALNVTALAYLYGTGRTRTIMVTNCLRLVFRIALFWVLQNYTNVGVDAAGIVMIASNGGFALVNFGVMVLYLNRFCRQHGISMWNRKGARA